MPEGLRWKPPPRAGPYPPTDRPVFLARRALSARRRPGRRLGRRPEGGSGLAADRPDVGAGLADRVAVDLARARHPSAAPRPPPRRSPPVGPRCWRPISAEVTRGSRSTQRRASWARDCPRRAAIVVEAAQPATGSSLTSPGSRDLPWAARESSGIPARYRSVSSPWASGTKPMQPMPSCSSTSSSPSSSIHRLIIEYDGWWMSAGTPSSRSIRAASGCAPRRRRRCRRSSALPCWTAEASAPIVSSSGRVRVEAVGVEDVDVVEAHPAQRWSSEAEQVLARAPLAVRARGHVVARLGGDDQLVAVGAEVLREERAEVRLGGAVGRAVVVGQVEVGDAQVEGAAQDGPLGVQRAVVAEVVPQAQRDRRAA